MIETVWKIIRGIRRWPEVEARVTSVYRYTAPPRKGQSRSKVIVGYRYCTLEGEEFKGSYASDACSTLYTMSEGDSFSLSYNPARPDRHWSDMYGLGLGDSSLFVTLWLIGMVTILTLILTSN